MKKSSLSIPPLRSSKRPKPNPGSPSIGADIGFSTQNNSNGNGNGNSDSDINGNASEKENQVPLSGVHQNSSNSPRQNEKSDNFNAAKDADIDTDTDMNVSKIMDTANANANININMNSSFSASLLNTTISSSASSSSRVLRSGETIDDFFCFHDSVDAGGSGSGSGSVSDEHRKLCEDVAYDRDGSASDLRKWIIVLKTASKRMDDRMDGMVDGNDGGNENRRGNGIGQDLIKLHKRAVSRFMSYQYQYGNNCNYAYSHNYNSTSPTISSSEKRDYFKMWLLYAKAQSKFGTREDASKTIRNIELKKMGEKEADFYICKALFELNAEKDGDKSSENQINVDALERAIAVLENGSENRAEPKDRLDRFLKKLTERRQEWQKQERSKSSKGSSLSDVDVIKSVDRVPAQAQTSENGAGVFKLNSIPSLTRRRMQLSRNVGSEDKITRSGTSLQIDRIAKMKTLDSTRARTSPDPSNLDHKDSSGDIENEPKLSNIKLQTSGLKSLDATSSKPLSTSLPGKVDIKNKIRSMRSTTSLLRVSKKRGLGGGAMRGAFGGGAKRVSAVDMNETADDDDDEEFEEKPDISYLLNWNPTGPRNNIAKKAVEEGRAKKYVLDAEKAPMAAPVNFLTRHRPMMDKIEEVTKESNSDLGGGSFHSNHSHSTISGNIGDVRSSDNTNTSTSKRKDCHETESSCEHSKSSSINSSLNSEKSVVSSDTKTDDSQRSRSSARSSVRSSNDKVSAIKSSRSKPGNASTTTKTSRVHGSSTAPKEQKSDAHPDFLNIIRNKNVITVNNNSYVKLGVIGKGGSCKVYRTLSADRKIVAIKMVKIGGMKRKSIEGYANEIALLRRLRGNPAIIQLYDSEVDYKRKAILLVMEPGEVDLNHVLQQQQLQRTNGESTSPINMNFIRLTWQQMLSAVHCIHQERIIHGDIKPANFLFVKGVLKIIDFGIAKAIQCDDTTNIYRESQVGTLNYMSPESIVDSGTSANGARMKCGKPSDVWSLGCILYQMCYAKTPFADLTMFPKLQAIINPNHAIEYPDTIDSAAIDAIKLCLQRKPEDRAPIVGNNGLLNEHWFLNSNCSANKLKTDL